MRRWQEVISEESIIEIFKKEEIGYLRYEDVLSVVGDGMEVIVVDLQSVELTIEEETIINHLKMAMEAGHLILLLNVQSARVVRGLTGIGLSERWILIRKGNESLDLYVSDAPKYMNTTAYYNKKVAVQGEYLFENKKRKGKQKFTVNFEGIEQYVKRQLEVVKDRVKMLQSQPLLEAKEMGDTVRTIYITIRENYAIDHMQTVENDLVWQITVKSEEKVYIAIQSLGTRFCPSAIGKLLSDEENDRSFFQNRIEWGIESYELSANAVTMKEAEAVGGFDLSVYESDSKVVFEYQMSKTREGIVSIYEYDMRYDRPCIPPLPKGSNIGAEVSAKINWEVDNNRQVSTPVALWWMIEYYACRVPIPAMMWEKKIVVDESLHIDILLME